MPLLPFLLLACDPDKDDHDHDHETGDTADTGESGETGESGDTSGEATHVMLTFTAAVNGAAFDCGSSYDKVGLTGTTWTPLDFRLYVHDVVLYDHDGNAVPVELEQDGMWQYQTVVLLDFEDKTGSCTNGTPETNTVIHGAVPAGMYHGVGFKVGVPFELNHADASTAPSPLNLTSLFWNWQSGYKFMRIDGKSTGIPEGMSFHLGSTACSADAYGTVTGCDNPNRPDITLDAMDAEMATITVDYGALMAGVDLDTNTEATMAICMSEPGDTDCAGAFAALGLDFGGVSGDPAAQTVFTAE